MNLFLKFLRWALAGLIGGVILLYFLDFARWLPLELHGLLHIQIVPAVLAGSAGILAVMLLLTLLFGRIYCSVLCPLGILQDFILRCKKWSLGIRKKGKKYRTKYEEPYNVIRYMVFVITASALAVGITFPLLLLDPYSNFGRIAVGLFRPVVIWINNAAASFLTARGNYTLYNVYVENTSWLVIGTAAVMLIVLIVLVLRKERIWCNTMCPVGTLLGFFSRFSLFRITLSDKCNNCKLCEGSCKSRCIDAEKHAVDTSRCVTCFNCLGKCKKGAISFQPTGWKVSPKTSESVAKEAYTYTGKPSTAKTEKPKETDKEQLSPTQISRRRFVKGTLMTVAMIPAAKVLAENFAQNLNGEAGAGAVLTDPTRRPLPPGAVSLDRFRTKCTACQLCISKCPTQVLQPAFLENGLTGIMQPYLRFRTESFCNYECTVCMDVCPNRALVQVSLEDKKLTRIGNVHFVEDKCIVKSKNQDCGACAEHCPTQAVHMVPFGDGTLTIPSIVPELCIGCGGCESICPVVTPAIFVEGLTVQERASTPTEDKIEDVEVTDFGF